MGRRLDDWQGFEEVYRETSLPVLRYLRRRLPAEEAEDALSEVYLTAWRRRHDLQGDALPWLYGIARLVVSNAVRSAGRSYRLVELMQATVDGRPGPAAEERAVDRIAAAEAMDRLSEADREALVLVAWDGMDVRQAAQVAGCGAAAFSVRLHRARKRLETLLGEGGRGEKGKAKGDGPGRGAGKAVAFGVRSGGRGGPGAGADDG
ncbi:RNA polymerase sigma factor [Streptomyces kebangsaanensis]|uniref:RNA polymerase sigma factor n=1 Tax=Streptomyces kebangsaanensis TaxID=864058 RepID=A0ABW6KUP0_9ACTN